MEILLNEYKLGTVEDPDHIQIDFETYWEHNIEIV